MAWSHIQGQHVGSGGGSTNWSFSKAGSTIGTGNLIVGIVTWGTASFADLGTVKVGTTSCTITNFVADTGNSQSIATFYLISAPAGQTTITAASSSGGGGGGALAMIWDEFSGNDGSSILDGNHPRVQSAASTTANAISTGATFGASGDLIYGATVCDDSVNTISTGTSPVTFATATADNADAQFFGVSLYSEWATATGASDVTFTISASGSMCTAGMAFTPASGGAPANVPYNPWPLWSPLLAQ